MSASNFLSENVPEFVYIARGNTQTSSCANIQQQQQQPLQLVSLPESWLYRRRPVMEPGCALTVPLIIRAWPTHHGSMVRQLFAGGGRNSAGGDFGSLSTPTRLRGQNWKFIPRSTVRCYTLSPSLRDPCCRFYYSYHYT